MTAIVGAFRCSVEERCDFFRDEPVTLRLADDEFGMTLEMNREAADELAERPGLLAEMFVEGKTAAEAGVAPR